MCSRSEALRTYSYKTSDGYADGLPTLGYVASETLWRFSYTMEASLGSCKARKRTAQRPALLLNQVFEPSNCFITRMEHRLIYCTFLDCQTRGTQASSPHIIGLRAYEIVFEVNPTSPSQSEVTRLYQQYYIGQRSLSGRTCAN